MKAATTLDARPRRVTTRSMIQRAIIKAVAVTQLGLTAGVVCLAVGICSSAASAGEAAQGSEGTAFWQFAPTPPMGWNSYDCWGTSVTEDQVLANAQYMQTHLLSHGWKYVVIDARWYDSVSPSDDRDFNKQRAGAKLFADQWGRLIPAVNRFPSADNDQGFKPLADRLHAMNLRFGFHMMRGIPRQAVNAKTPIADSNFTAADAGDPKNICSWCPDMYGVRNNAAGQAWYDAMFKLYASWGLDFIKVDDLSRPYHAEEIEMIRKAIDKCGRPIVLSSSPGPTDLKRAEHVMNHTNQWRVSGDFWDRWKDLDHQFDLLAQWTRYAGPGHFPDADMIPFGHIGIKCTIAGKERQTRFTHQEQRTLMSLWSLASSPLMLGNHLPDTDEWTLSLLTNDGVLAIDQDPLGQAATRVTQKGKFEVWVKPLKDGSKAVGLFNRGDDAAVVDVDWTTAGVNGKQTIWDVWQSKSLGDFDQKFSATINPHDVVLLRLTPSSSR